MTISLESARDFSVSGGEVLTIEGGRAYAVQNYPGSGRESVLGTFDLTNRTNATFLGSGFVGGVIRNIKVRGQLAYAADATAGLRIIDVSDPVVPKTISVLRTGGDAQEIDSNEQHAFLADGMGGLRIIDISDPQKPGLVGGVTTDGAATSVSVIGRSAYVADQRSLQIIDISDPSRPTVMGSFRSAGIAWSVTVAGSLAFLSEGIQGDPEVGFRIINVSDPASPKSVGLVKSPGWQPLRAIVKEKLAFVVSNIDFHIFNIENPADPKHVGGAIVRPYGWNRYSFAVADDRLYVDGVVHDITDLSLPKRTFEFLRGGVSQGLVVRGNLAYVGETKDRWHIYDISKSDRPQLVGKGDRPAYGHVLELAGNHLYVGSLNGENGVGIFDISNMAAPKELSRIKQYPFRVLNVQVIGQTAYFGYSGNDYKYGLWILDVQKPESPQTLSVSDFGAFLGVVGRFAYFSTSDPFRGSSSITASEIRIYDVSDARLPFLTTKYLPTVPIHSMQVSGSRAYLSGPFGFEVLDVSIPSVPKRLGNLEPRSRSSSEDIVGFHVANDFAFLWKGSSSIQVLDVRDPGRLTQVDVSLNVPPNFPVWWAPLHVSGNRMVAAPQSLQIYEISGGQRTQTIQFSTLPDRLLSEPPFLLEAAASSGLPVSFRVISGPAKIEGRAVTLTGPGLVTIRAEHSGDLNYSSTHVERTFTVWERLPTGVVSDWIADKFPSVPPVQRGPAADPDNDGAPNALEYFFGTDPGRASPQDGRLRDGALITEGGQTFWLLTLAVNPAISNTVQWQIEETAALVPVAWRTVTNVSGQTGGGEVTVKVPVNTERRFYRLKLVLP